MDRRHFLKLSTATTAATVLTGHHAIAYPITNRYVRIDAWTGRGQRMPKAVMEQVYFLDLNDEPLPNGEYHIDEGHQWTELPQASVAIAINLSVIGFGNVKLYADNFGRGYRAQDFPLNLNLACAETRIHRVQTAIAAWKADGYIPSAHVLKQIERAEHNLIRARRETETQSMAAWANESLKEGLWAGETAVFEQAKQAIAKQGPRPNFLFGANAFGHPQGGDKYDQQFEQLFNFATLPLYWRSSERQQGQPNFAQIDRTLAWLHKANITPKGHPLVWFHEVGVPDWVRDQPYSKVRELVRTRIMDVTQYFGHRIPYYDIINEAHDIAWSNELNFSREQFLEITRLASETSATGFPKIQRIINTCCSWAKYIPSGPQDKPLQSAYQYLQSCLDAEIPFEIIGIQLYYPNQDMFEIHRVLERFSTLGKPIHITELGVSSSKEPDEKSYFKKPSGLWHGPWSETIQADWIEQFYTLCFSKPYIKAITWWDFADANFWPHGGFLRRDMTPKESFFRLKELQAQFRQAG